MSCEFYDRLDYATCNGRVHNISECGETDDDLVDIGAVKIFHDGGYEHD